MASAAPRIGIVSLGCPKALVDSERIVSKLRAERYELSGDDDGETGLEPGDIVTAGVERADDYDLWAARIPDA